MELENVYEGLTGSGLSYTIAESFHLPEDMHILPVYYALSFYYNMQQERQKSLQYQALFEAGLQAAKRRWSTKTRGVVVKRRGRATYRNPNYPPPTIT